MNITEHILRIAERIAGHLKEESVEDQEFKNWIADEHNQALFDRLADENTLREKALQLSQIDTGQAWKQMQQHLRTSRPLWLRVLPYAAAIALPLTLGLWYTFRPPVQVPDISMQLAQQSGHDYQKATLTLSGGRTIDLSQPITEIQGESGVEIRNLKSGLQYTEIESEAHQVPVYHTLATPRGGEYHMVLSDGSKVWLNAESKLTFPARFDDSNRLVRLEGEAYFEVAHDQNRPFVVSTGAVEVGVLGTSFNVTAYPGESQVQTTLVSGKVKVSVSKTDKPVILAPGEQAGYTSGDNELSVRAVDVSVYTAWKDGMLIFDNETLESMMKRLARWYDFEVTYERESLKTYHFSGSLKKYDSEDEILSLIESSANVTFMRTGRRITVRSKS